MRSPLRLIKILFISVKKNLKIALMTVLLILSVAMIIRWLNGEHMMPWKTQIQLLHPQKVVEGCGGMFVLDNGNHRLLHISSDGKVDRMLLHTEPASVANGIYSLYVEGDNLYMASSLIREGGIYSKTENVFCYEYGSKKMHSYFTEQFNDSARVVRGSVRAIWTSEDSLYFVRKMGGRCSIYSVPKRLDEKEEIPMAVCLRSVEVDEPIIRVEHQANDVILILGKYQHAWLWSLDDLREVDFAANSEEEPVLLAHGQRVPLGWGLIMHNLLFLLSVLYILALLCVLIAHFLRRLNLDPSEETHHGRDAVLIVFVSVLIAGFYTNQLYRNYQKGYFKQICSLREQLDYLIDKHYSDVLEGIADQGNAYLADSMQSQRALQLDAMMRQMTQCPSLQQDVYSDIFLIDSIGQGVNVADANETYIFGDVMSTPDEVEHILSNPVPGQPYRIWDDTGFYYASIVPKTVHGKQFCIEVGCFVDDVKKASVKMVASLFFELLIIFLVVYTIISLLRKLPGHLRFFRQGRQSGRSDAGVWLSGVLAFLFYAISAIDQGVMVYLVYSLSEGCTPAQMALRASLPMLLYMGIGMTAYLIQPALRKWFGDRRINMGAGVLAVGVFFMMGVAVLKGSFVVYCIGKGVSGMLMGIIFNSMYALPLIAKDHHLRNEGLASITLSCLAANILFISLGGYISQYLGYSAVYFVNALLAVVVIFVAATVFTKSESQESANADSASSEGRLKTALQFLLSGKMIAYYMGVLLPFGMMNAYCYYLYPIYAEAAGISVSQLANMIVFGYALAYICGEKLVRWKNERNGLWVLVNVMVIMAILEITFAVAGNIWWATLVLMVCCVMIAIPRSEANVYIAEESKRKGLDVRDTNSGFAFALDATEAIASPLMGWCVSMELVFGTNLIGLISLCLTSVFALWQRRTTHSNSSDETMVIN